ncbi:hypothetical protein [Bacteroides finegoldii]|uniref:hypothetical protein n=1 Tax=Bacteroides finegoldii TaxID=338188 RepID=UPI00189EE996|nr:hypothetical protein [Bacteroides finegoldii]
MKRNITLFLATICVALGWFSCNDDSCPENPTLLSPVSGMMLEVNGADYTVTPQLQEDGSLSNTYLLKVKTPSTTAIVKQLDLSDPSASVTIKVGDVITFSDNKFAFEWKKGAQIETLFLEMSFPPEVMYIVRSKEGYALDKTTAQTIVSVANNGLFEGYVDLSDANWDNIGLVQGDESVYFDVSDGLNTETYGSFTMGAKPSPGTGSYPSDGPWADWSNVNNSNETMFYSGVWKINFNAATKVMTVLETQWSVTGTAVGNTKNMAYSTATRTWSLTTELSAGTLKFTTVPMHPNDPIVTYGIVSDGQQKLSETGTNITVSEAGTYRIELDLSTSSYHYTLTK